MNDNADGLVSKLTVLIGPALNLIPHVGGAIASAWSEYDTRKRFQRIQETISMIQSKLSDARVNEAAASDAGIHLLDLVLREAQMQHCERKREYLANLLVASWIDENPPQATFDESLLFLRAITSFSESHLAILSKLSDAGTDGSVSFSEIASVIVADSDPEDSALIILKDLCSDFALAKRAWDLNRTQPKHTPTLLGTGNFSPEGIARKCFHAITPRGVRFVNYVIRTP
jgi:hypothetical protein